MKKLLTVCAILAVAFGTMAAEVSAAKQPAKRGVGAGIGYYFLNRVLDFTDVISLGITLGAQGSAEATLTEFCRVGFGYGEGVEARMNFRRQYGIGKSSLADASFFCFTYDRDKYVPWLGTIPEYYMFSDTFTLINFDEEAYKYQAVDRWAVGVRAGVIVNAAVEFHPVEFADFFAGLVGFDLTGDDR